MNNKVNVLFLLHLPPPVHGAAMACNYIKNSKYINENINGTYINLATNSKLSESGKAGLKKIRTFYSLVKQVRNALKKEKFDLCHMSIAASGPGFYKDLVLVSMLKKKEVKIIYHFHNKGVKAASKNDMNRRAYSYAFKGTQSILLSSYLYPDISDYVDKKDVYYCPYGTPLTIENPVSKRNNNTVCKFLYLSNMMRQKGVFVLLDALKVLKDKQPEFECHFIGGWADITEEEFKEKINSLGLNKQVIVHGPKYGDEKFPFMEETNVFVFPTFYHYECLPFVLLESMEFGLPVISTPEGAIRDIIEDGHTGYIVPQKNVEKLAARMEVLINDPELRKKMGEAGRKRYERLFTLDKFEKRLTDILIEASGNSPKQ